MKNLLKILSLALKQESPLDETRGDSQTPRLPVVEHLVDTSRTYRWRNTLQIQATLIGGGTPCRKA